MTLFSLSSHLKRISYVLPLLVWTSIAQAEEPAANHWDNCGWGGGGCFWSVQFHPTKEDVIYMGGDVAGIYKTEDAGKQWKMINTGLGGVGIFSLAIDPKNPETVYAGSTVGLYKTTDGGAHWEFCPETGPKQLGIITGPNKCVRSIAVDPSNSNVVYAGTPAGKIYKSEDGAKTWIQSYELKTPGIVFSVTVNPAQPSQIFGSTQTEGVVMSNDAGKTWKELETPKKAAHVAFAPSDAKILYGSFFEDGVQKSVDGGLTWTPCSPDEKGKVGILETVVSPTNPDDVYCISKISFSGRFFSSHDGGKTWTEHNKVKPDYVNNPTLPGAIRYRPDGFLSLNRCANISISPVNPTHLFIAADWRPVFSDNSGETWEERGRGADISCVNDLRFKGDRAYAAVMDEGVLMSANGGANWQQLWPKVYSRDISGHAWQLVISTNKNGSDRIVSTVTPWNKKVKNNIVVISEDGGKTYKATEAGLPNYTPKPNTMWGQGYMRALTADPNNPRTLYAGIDGDPEPGKCGGGIFKSEDGGLTWKQLANQPGSRRMFFGLAVDPTDSRRLFWGATGKGGGLYRSEDEGNSWKLVFKNEMAIFNVLVTREGTVYCPGSNLWRSADHGSTWKKISDFQTNRAIVGLEVNPSDPKTIWISSVRWGEAAEGGVYKTRDGGVTWENITGDLPYVKPIVLRFNPLTSELWAAGVGVFKTKQ